MQMEGGMGGSGCHWHTACKAAGEKAERSNERRSKSVLWGESPAKELFGKVLATNRLEMASKDTAF